MAIFNDLQITPITIDQAAIVDFITEIGSLSMPALLWYIFQSGIWFILFLFCIYLFKIFWLSYRQTKNADGQEFIILAIDVPADNDQSPKAVENIFTNFTALMGGANFQEKYWDGATPKSLSLELVSIDGYIQFLIRVNVKFRDVVESAVYAQYPDCQISEIEDYTEKMPDVFPHPHYKMFGMEFSLGASEAYPIRTYKHFEDAMSKEIKDPMAALLENMSRLQAGEQLWLQFVIVPVKPNAWDKVSSAEVDAILGKKAKPKQSTLGKILLWPINVIVSAGDALLGAGGEAGGGGDDKGGEDNAMMKLTPGQKEKLEAVEMKSSKQGFRTKFRLIYIGRQSTFNKARGVAAIMGSIRQFNTQNLNFFVPDGTTITDIDYFFKKQRVAARQRKLMSHFKDRSIESGAKGEGFILNTEELASVYHFPLLSVKAPLLKRASGKRSEPPVALAVLAQETEAQAAERQEAEGQDSQPRGGDITSVFTDMPLEPPKK